MPRATDNRHFAVVIGVLLLALTFAAATMLLSASRPSSRPVTVYAGDVPTLVTIGRSATTLLSAVALSVALLRLGPGRGFACLLTGGRGHSAVPPRIVIPLRI